MNAPADKIAKRISAAEWFARFAPVALPRTRVDSPQQTQMRPPADRIAVRA